MAFLTIFEKIHYKNKKKKAANQKKPSSDDFGRISV
jgi:hypothetical protein